MADLLHEPSHRKIPLTGLQLQRRCGAGFYRDGHMSPTALEQQAVRGLRDGLQPYAASSKVCDRLLERLAWRQPCSNFVTHTDSSSVSLCVPAMARSRVLSAPSPWWRELTLTAAPLVYLAAISPVAHSPTGAYAASSGTGLASSRSSAWRSTTSCVMRSLARDSNTARLAVNVARTRVCDASKSCWISTSITRAVSSLYSLAPPAGTWRKSAWRDASKVAKPSASLMP